MSVILVCLVDDKRWNTRCLEDVPLHLPEGTIIICNSCLFTLKQVNWTSAPGVLGNDRIWSFLVSVCVVENLFVLFFSFLRTHLLTCAPCHFFNASPPQTLKWRSHRRTPQAAIPFCWESRKGAKAISAAALQCLSAGSECERSELKTRLPQPRLSAETFVSCSRYSDRVIWCSIKICGKMSATPGPPPPFPSMHVLHVALIIKTNGFARRTANITFTRFIFCYDFWFLQVLILSWNIFERKYTMCVCVSLCLAFWVSATTGAAAAALCQMICSILHLYN